MKFKWPPFQYLLPGNFTIGEIIYTLLEHEIPILYVSTKNNELFLNYFIDEDDDNSLDRFINVPISKMKLRALVTGGVDLLSCLQCEQLYLYDVNWSGEVSFSTKVEFSKIPDEALPTEGVVLPEFSEEFIDEIFGFTSGELCFIVSDNSTENTISFDKLSKFLSSTQKLALRSTIYYCDDYEIDSSNINTELQVVAHKAASFAIVSKVKDPIVLESIYSTFSKLTIAFLNYENDEIYDLLDRLPVKLAESIFEYYKQILENDYSSIIKIKNKSLYLDSSQAKTIKLKVNSSSYIRKETVYVTGYLLGVNVKTSYYYFEEKKNGIPYRGKFDPDYLNSHNSFTVNSETLWKAKIEHCTEFKFSRFITTHTLKNLELVEEKGH